jgi:hypothetical protein
MTTVSGGPLDREWHLGVDFAVWRNEGAWLWLLINPGGDVGTIGVGTTEAQAMRDACLSIEEKLTVF